MKFLETLYGRHLGTEVAIKNRLKEEIAKTLSDATKTEKALRLLLSEGKEFLKPMPPIEPKTFSRRGK